MSNVEQIFIDLNELRFRKLIQYERPQKQEYIKRKIREEDKKERWIRSDKPTGVCCKCSDVDIVSHGIHSYDFLNIYNEHNKTKIKYDNFHKDGVLFVLENPSKNEETCYEERIENKHVAQGWWWLDNDEAEKVEGFHDTFAKQKSYGAMFHSVINIFRLENAYITNFVKCGKQKNGEFQRLYNYDPEVKNNCFEKFLIEEIKIIKPKVIFALGKAGFNLLNEKEEEINKAIDNKPLIIRLPHPNSQITNEDRKTLLYCNILKGLINSSVITEPEEIKTLWLKFTEYKEVDKNNNTQKMRVD